MNEKSLRVYRNSAARLKRGEELSDNSYHKALRIELGAQPGQEVSLVPWAYVEGNHHLRLAWHNSPDYPQVISLPQYMHEDYALTDGRGAEPPIEQRRAVKQWLFQQGLLFGSEQDRARITTYMKALVD